MDITIDWLGQSGFIIASDDFSVATDLYLSDYCQKISKLDHTRLTPIPIAPEKLGHLDAYLISHAHIDHCDPETIGPILSHGDTTFYGPKAIQSKIVDAKLPMDRFQFVKENAVTQLSENVSLCPIPAAHEDLEMDENGDSVALSFLLAFANARKVFFIGGDTIPYDGQGDQANQAIAALGAENYQKTAILPINGRDKERADLGFKGTLLVEEAAALVKAINATALIPCHFGMFALNNPREDFSTERFAASGVNAIQPKIGEKITI